MRNRGTYKSPCSERCEHLQTCDILQIVHTTMYGDVFSNCPDANFDDEADYEKVNWPKELPHD